jgi:hypothetical protein
MMLQSKLAIRGLDLRFARFSGDAQNFVVVAFCFRGQGPSSLSVWIARYAHHGGTQQALLQLVPTLQFLDDRIVWSIAGFNHFDGLVQVRIKGFARCGNCAHA